MNPLPNQMPPIIPINAEMQPNLNKPNILLSPLLIKNPLPPPPNIILNSPVSTNCNDFYICNSNFQNQNVIVNPNYSQNTLLGYNNANILVEPQNTPQMLYAQMEISEAPPNIVEPDYLDNIQDDKSLKSLIDSVYNVLTKEDLKERNRIAAQKWRKKKNNYMAQLESTNYELRKEAIYLNNQAKALKKENEFFEEELHFFQSFMSKIMINSPKEKEENN